MKTLNFAEEAREHAASMIRNDFRPALAALDPPGEFFTAPGSEVLTFRSRTIIDALADEAKLD